MDIRSDSQDNLITALRNGQLEIALIYAFDLPAELNIHKVVESIGHALLSANHPLAANPLVSLAELNDTPYIAVTTSPARTIMEIVRLSGISSHHTWNSETLT